MFYCIFHYYIFGLFQLCFYVSFMVIWFFNFTVFDELNGGENVVDVVYNMV